MTVLITGGTGFIGAGIARKMVEQGREVVLFEAYPNLNIIEDIKDEVKLVRGDVSNWAEVLDTVKSYKIKEIYHTAALLSDNAEKFPHKAYQVNATGTWHVLEAARLFEVGKVIFTSTVGTYGDHVSTPVTNHAPQFPRIMYGATKVAGERLGEYYFYRFGVNFRGIRFPSVIGPGRGSGGVSAYTTLAIQMPAQGRAFDIYVSPESSLPVLYIDDAARALLMLSEAPEENLTSRMYNLKGIACTAQEIVDQVTKFIPDAGLRFVPDEKITEMVDRLPALMDESLAKKDWGWEESFELASLIKTFIEGVQKYPQRYTVILE